MKARQRLRTALTIAGSDSGGGAGVQADLKTFLALGLHGTCAITCLTAQNPGGVRAIQASRSGMVKAQTEAVFEAFQPAALKTGMLYSAATIREVSSVLETQPRVPLVVDPVMVATSGARLLQPTAVRTLIDHLLPLACLITPNADEAGLLLDRRIQDVDDLRTAARELQRRFGCAALVKGGHLRGLRTAVDLFYDGRDEWLLEAPFVRGVSTHGTGCTYSAAIAGYLALGNPLSRAVALAKQFITAAIAGSVRVEDHDVLGFSAR
jgi:hydroxymethylpyrimidine/phosphomethylpyrimidine kinase